MCATFTSHPLTQQKKNAITATITHFPFSATGDRLLTAEGRVHFWAVHARSLVDKVALGQFIIRARRAVHFTYQLRQCYTFKLIHLLYNLDTERISKKTEAKNMTTTGGFG